MYHYLLERSNAIPLKPYGHLRQPFTSGPAFASPGDSSLLWSCCNPPVTLHLIQLQSHLHSSLPAPRDSPPPLAAYHVNFSSSHCTPCSKLQEKSHIASPIALCCLRRWTTSVQTSRKQLFDFSRGSVTASQSLNSCRSGQFWKME